MVISSDSVDNVTEANLSYRVSVGNDPGTFGLIKPGESPVGKEKGGG